MTIGTLVHITAAKKLMIKIDEKTYDNLHNRLTAECKKKNFPCDRIAVYSRENDDGDEEHFAMASLDKYDRLNMRKYEVLLRKDVNFSSRMKPYDFMNDDNEQVCGIHLELISIRQMKPRKEDAEEIEHSKTEARREVDECDAVEKKMVIDMLDRMASDIKKHGHVTTETLADAEKMISDMPDHTTYALKLVVFPIRARSEGQMAAVPAQPPLKRQTAVTRRRRTPVTATEQELTDVEKQIKHLDDLIAANERAIGADE